MPDKMNPDPHSQLVVVLDFGSQYSQLIARRIRECHVYCEIHPFDLAAAEIAAMRPSGIVLSGGPASVPVEGSPLPDPAIFRLDIPILGICYGLQVVGQLMGGSVIPATHREYGKASMKQFDPQGLFHGLDPELTVWMSHSFIPRSCTRPAAPIYCATSCSGYATVNPSGAWGRLSRRKCGASAIKLAKNKCFAR
jgi:GMP synthase (glutamine-hydrolysing) A subunit